MTREYPLYRLRMPPELKKELKKLSSKNRRSLNSEIVIRLENTLVNEGINIQANGINEEKKSYIVRPGDLFSNSENSTMNENSNDDSIVKIRVAPDEGFNSSDFKILSSRKEVNNVTLAVAIKKGESMIEEQNKTLSLEKRALLFTLIYGLLDDDKPDASNLDSKTINMLLELAS